MPKAVTPKAAAVAALALGFATAAVACVGELGHEDATEQQDLGPGGAGQGGAADVGGADAGGASSGSGGSVSSSGDSGGSGGQGGSGGNGGTAPTGCPASGPVELSAWTSNPWIAPDSGHAEVRYQLSQEHWLHYERFELDLDIHVTSPQTTYNCFLELRNIGGPKNGPFPWRYFSVCTKNENPKKMIHIVYAADDGYTPTPFSLKADTDYHVHLVFDAKASSSSLTMTEAGGTPVTITVAPLTSSIAPQGQGLSLLVGFRTDHPDYPVIKPPWGWEFRNLEVVMTPGGPWGVDAPACP